jgi:hypothetical protein
VAASNKAQFFKLHMKHRSAMIENGLIVLSKTVNFVARDEIGGLCSRSLPVSL